MKIFTALIISLLFCTIAGILGLMLFAFTPSNFMFGAIAIMGGLLEHAYSAVIAGAIIVWLTLASYIVKLKKEDNV